MSTPRTWLSQVARNYRGSKFNAGAAFLSIALIIAFAIGDQVGQARHKSPVDEAIGKVLEKDARGASKDVLQRAAIDAVLKATGDQWANYFPTNTAKIFSQSLQGRYSGIGIWLRKNSSGVLEVSSISPNSPAAQAGIKVLDTLNEVNGVSMDGASVATAVAALRGNAGTSVSISLTRNQKGFQVTVTRASVLSGDVVANQIAPGIVYIQVSAMTQNVTTDVTTALNNYRHDRGIILYLRDNPGGLISQAQGLGSLFLNQGAIVSYSRKGESDIVLSSTNSNPDIAPMTVLINRSTASSAEALTGALQDRNRAVILGEQSYGKGSVQEVITLSDGSKLEITVGKYRTPSGHIIDQVGIGPDLLVPETTEISKALAVLQGLRSFEKGTSSSSSK